MADAAKVPVQTEQKGGVTAAAPQVWRPLERLRREVDRLFDDFGAEFRRSPFRRSLPSMEPILEREFQVGPAPAVDIVEKDNVYEVTADVPGFDEKNIEVKLQNGSLCIKGERKSEKDEKKKGLSPHRTRVRFLRAPLRGGTPVPCRTGGA